jgi:hypothetical protein
MPYWVIQSYLRCRVCSCRCRILIVCLVAWSGFKNTPQSRRVVVDLTAQENTLSSSLLSTSQPSSQPSRRVSLPRVVRQQSGFKNDPLEIDGEGPVVGQRRRRSTDGALSTLTAGAAQARVITVVADERGTKKRVCIALHLQLSVCDPNPLACSMSVRGSDVCFNCSFRDVARPLFRNHRGRLLMKLPRVHPPHLPSQLN